MVTKKSKTQLKPKATKKININSVKPNNKKSVNFRKLFPSRNKKLRI